MKQSRISRMIRIMTALQTGQRYKIDDFVQMLKISRRTVFRDLKDLKTAGVHYYYDQNKGFYKAGAGLSSLAPDINTTEAAGLLLLIKARNHFCLPFKESVLSAALKIESNLPAKIKRRCISVLQNTTIRTGPVAQMDLSDKIFAQLEMAITKKRIVDIHYCLPYERKCIRTRLNPYRLVCNDHRWYVLGKSSFHNDTCVIKLSRIKDLNILDKCYIKDKKFNVEDYFGRAWSMIAEGKLYNIKLRFLPEIAHSVAEIQWHSTQKVTFENDGSAIIEFRVDGLNEIIWWILSYGHRIQILAPNVLRQKAIDIAEKTAIINRRYFVSGGKSFD